MHLTQSLSQVDLKPGLTVIHPSMPAVAMVVKASREVDTVQVCKVAWVEDGASIRTAEFPAAELAPME